jgi:glycosyltransferase involved in cell wall biosynthesis
LGVPVITSLHRRFETYLDYYGLRLAVPAVEQYLKAFYARSDVILAPNQPMRQLLREQGIVTPVEIWGRGVDNYVFSPDRRDREWRRLNGYKDADVVILFFGRVVREKGIETFVQVVRELRDRGYPVRPLIVGEGPEADRLRRQLPDAVFTGHLDGEELGRAVASADILVNPSTTEAFGNVKLEAMAAGVVVVSADVGSARALITADSTGVLVEPTKAVNFTDAVDALLRSPRRRQALATAAVAAAITYRWSDILENVLEVYRAIPF